MNARTRRGYAPIKRTLDAALAAALLLLLSPLIAVIALLVRLNLGAPILFRQQRPGLGGRLFTIMKFRSMGDARDEHGLPRPDADRLTRFGRFLRSTSLDELPELVNVLKGDMSLVGPRPLLSEYLPLYSSDQARRHEVRPGMTGWAQVNGRNGSPWSERLKADVWYVEHCSFLLDARILLRTLATVVARKGINEPGEATMTPFRGTAE